MAKAIEDIEGIGPSYGEKLRSAGIKTAEALLEAGAAAQGRSALAEKTGLSEAQILKWVNMADLFRISGIAGQFAELLECAGVDTVKELRNRNAESLADTLAKVNEEKKLCKATPSAKTLASWIEQAKALPPKVEH
jgi:predicted flap endonuclease-1-like 5' DNA nuclease